MRHKRSLLFIIVTLLALTTLACSLGGNGQSEPTTTSPSEATPTASPSEEGEELNIDTNALEQLQSYRIRYVWEHRSGDNVVETNTVEGEETRNPRAVHYRISDNSGSATEIVQIENNTWMCTPSCIQIQQSAEEEMESLLDIFIDPADLLIESEYQYAGKESVNGIPCRHYHSSTPASILQVYSHGELLEAQADAWIADSPDLPNFVTRYSGTWKVRDEEGVEHTYSYTFDVYDINTPITIEPPEGAAEIPEDIPIYEDAAELFIAEGMISYVSNAPLEEIATFYRDNMPANGWTSVSESTYGDSIMQLWSKDGRNATIMISAEDEKASVAIMLQ